MIVSNLLLTYCKKVPQCYRDKDVKAIMRGIEKTLNEDCSYTNPDEMDEVT